MECADGRAVLLNGTVLFDFELGHSRCDLPCGLTAKLSSEGELAYLLRLQ